MTHDAGALAGARAQVAAVHDDPARLRLGMAGAFLSLRGVLPNRCPLALHVERYIADERHLGRLLDYAVIVPRLGRLYEWCAKELAEQRHVWRTPKMPVAGRELERATMAR